MSRDLLCPGFPYRSLVTIPSYHNLTVRFWNCYKCNRSIFFSQNILIVSLTLHWLLRLTKIRLLSFFVFPNYSSNLQKNHKQKLNIFGVFSCLFFYFFLGGGGCWRWLIKFPLTFNVSFCCVSFISFTGARLARVKRRWLTNIQLSRPIRDNLNF